MRKVRSQVTRMLFFSDLVGPGLGREGVTAVVTDEQTR